MIDQQTKQHLQQNFEQIKPQLKQVFPALQDQDLQQGKNNPDQLVQTIAKKSGQDQQQIEQTLMQVVQQQKQKF